MPQKRGEKMPATRTEKDAPAEAQGFASAADQRNAKLAGFAMAREWRMELERRADDTHGSWQCIDKS
jgi:hypothetical protein